jgi:hypothetical protein
MRYVLVMMLCTLCGCAGAPTMLTAGSEQLLINLITAYASGGKVNACSTIGALQPLTTPQPCAPPANPNAVTYAEFMACAQQQLESAIIFRLQQKICPVPTGG